MGAHGQGAINFAIAKNLDQFLALGFSHEALLHQLFRRHLRTGLKDLEIGHIHNRIIVAERRIAVAEAAHEWEAFRQARLTAIKCSMYCSAGAGLLTFGSTAGGLTATGAMATANAPLTLVRTRSWPQIAQFHQTTSSTFTR